MDDLDTVLPHLGVSRSVFAFVWGAPRCTQRWDLESGGYHGLKDLKKVRKLGYRLPRVLVVDDSAEKLARHYGNLIVVPPFYGESDDAALPRLAAYLRTLTMVRNVRGVEKRGWLG